MNQSHLLALVLIGLLSGCDQPPKPATELNCKGSPKKCPKAEKTASGDAFFRQGSFKKSSGMEW